MTQDVEELQTMVTIRALSLLQDSLKVLSSGTSPGRESCGSLTLKEKGVGPLIR